MMLFTFARILLCLNTQSVHTFLFVAVNLLSLSQLSPYGSGPRGGDSHMKQTGMLVGNFEFNP